MNLLQRHGLMRGTKHCVIRRTLIRLAMAASCLLIGLASADYLIATPQPMHLQLIQSQRNTRECLDVLEGKVQMVDRPNGERYGRQAVVTWNVYEEVKKLVQTSEK